MAVREVVQIGDKILRQRSEEVKEFDNKLSDLLQDMKDTLEAEHGAGLAAVQIGELKRVFVVSVEEGYFEFINPRITKTAGTQTSAQTTGTAGVQTGGSSGQILPGLYAASDHDLRSSAFSRCFK